MKNKIFLLFVITLLCVNFASAIDWDNKIEYNETTETIVIENAFGLGADLIKANLQENGCDDEGRFCQATLPITLYEDGSLIEGRRFYTIDGINTKLQDIRWSRLEYLDVTNGKLVEFNENDQFQAGEYLVKFSGEKKPARTVDWQIKIKGEWTTPWAIWGGVFQGDEYQISLFADSINETGLEINDVIITELSDGVFKINTSNPNDDISRALIMKTLFYGTDGSDPRSTSAYITNPSAVYSRDIRDRDKRGVYAMFSQSTRPVPDSLYTGTFSNTISNLNVSSWSIVSTNSPFGPNVQWEIEEGTIRNIQSGGAGTIDEIGTDTSLDGIDNPSNCQLQGDTDSSGYNLYARVILLSNGSISWVAGGDTAGLSYLNTDFLVDEGFPTFSYVEGSIALNSPADASISTTIDVLFNATVEILNGATLSNRTLFVWYQNGTLLGTNSTTGLSGTSESSEDSISGLSADGVYVWNKQYCDSDGDCAFAPNNYSLSIDADAPSILINSGDSIQDYGFVGVNNTINFTATDTNLDSCWLSYNGTNTSVACSSGVSSEIIFPVEEGVYSGYIYSNDTIGNVGSRLVNWSYKLFEENQTFNTQTRSGAVENYSIDILLAVGYEISSVNLTYNGTDYPASIFSSGQNRIVSISNFEVPVSTADYNATFYWDFELADLTEVISTSKVQEIAAVLVDNCSVYTNVLLNISLLNEETKEALLGDIEIDYQVLNVPNYDAISTLSTTFTNVSDVTICSKTNFSQFNLAYSTEIRYEATDYAPELYHIQRSEILSSPTQISLYDLTLNESTEFKVTYQDDSFNFVDGAILQLKRKYISEGTYEVVEAPLTSRDGVAVIHVDLDARVYSAVISKNGVILDTFDNIVFKCTNELSGDCEQKLLGAVNPQNSITIDTLQDFTYTIPTLNETDDIITATFTMPSGTPSAVNIVMLQRDQFGNQTLCNKTVTSSSGSIFCQFDRTIGDSYVDYKLYKDGVLMAYESYKIEESNSVDFLGNNYIIVVIFILSLVGMAITSPEWMVLVAVISLFLSGSLWLINGMNFVVGLGILMWLMIAAAIIIFKLSKQEDR